MPKKVSVKRAKTKPRKASKAGRADNKTGKTPGVLKQQCSIKNDELIKTPEPSAIIPAKRRGRPRICLAPELLEESRRCYEETTATIKSIALLCSVSDSIITRLAKENNWTRFSPQPKKRGPAKMQFTPALLEECRRRYEETTQGVEAIGLFCGVSSRKIESLAKENNWTRFHPEPLDVPKAARLQQRAAALAESAQNETDPVPADTIAAGIAEVLAGVRNELAIIQAMRARMRDEPQSTLDAQRTAQTYSSLNATLMALQRMQSGTQPIHYAGHYDDDMPADIDEFRNELARRIRIFVAGRRTRSDAQRDGAPPLAET